MNSTENAKRIRIFVCDVDGTLTDGKIYIGAQGEAMKAFCVQDGLGISAAQKLGYGFVIITGRNSVIVENRARELKIEEVYQSCGDKLALLERLCQEKNLTLDEVAYIGDDLNDLAAIEAVGLGCATANAAATVRERAAFLAARSGGDGAVREVIEFVLSAQDRWQEAVKLYTKG